MKSYKFYFSVDQKRSAIEQKMMVQCLAKKYFEAFTLYNAVHFWQDKHETGLVLEVISGISLRDKTSLLALELKTYLKQTEIFITWHEVNGDFF